MYSPKQTYFYAAKNVSGRNKPTKIKKEISRVTTANWLDGSDSTSDVDRGGSLEAMQQYKLLEHNTLQHMLYTLQTRAYLSGPWRPCPPPRT